MTVPRDAAPTHVATVMLEAPSDATATMYIVSESVPATTVVPPALVPRDDRHARAAAGTDTCCSPAGAALDAGSRVAAHVDNRSR